MSISNRKNLYDKSIFNRKVYIYSEKFIGKVLSNQKVCIYTKCLYERSI